MQEDVVKAVEQVIPGAMDMAWVQYANIIHPGIHCSTCYVPLQHPPYMVEATGAKWAVVSCDSCKVVYYAGPIWGKP